MSVAAMLPPAISKEVRALALPWLACASCLLMMGMSNAPRLFGPLAVIAYLVGTVALGALSIGHEYTGRTLSLLLTLPARRERLLATKLGVLTVMLLALWVVAETFVFRGMPGPADAKQMIALIPLICGLFLAPWLTMVCRSAIAGTVFALTIPGVLLVAGELFGVAKYGHGPGMEAFRMAFAWSGTLGVCAIGAVMSWWLFMRLEAIEGPGQDVQLPQWLRFGGSRSSAAPQLQKHHPVWLLVKKEIRLQQLPLALTALYVLEWLAVVWLANVSDSKYWDLFSTLSLLHMGLLPMLLGSSASAGERQIGTLEWQVLLPMTAAKQWAVKAGVVFGLSIVLALGLPAMLIYAGDQILGDTTPSLVQSDAIALVLLLASGSLYVSSLCSSALWALVMSLPATLGAWIFLNVMMDWARIRWFLATRVPTAVTLLLVAGFIAILLRFGLANHRSADRPAARVWTQVVLMAALITAGVAMAQAFLR